MKFWGQREFRSEYGVRPPEKKSLRELFEQFSEKWQCMKQSFPGRDKQSNEDVVRVRQGFHAESQEVHLPSKCGDRDGP